MHDIDEEVADIVHAFVLGIGLIGVVIAMFLIAGLIGVGLDWIVSQIVGAP